MDEDKLKETEELRKDLGFFGEVAKVGFWGALFAVIAGFASKFLLGNGTAKQWLENTGFEAKVIADKVAGVLGEELYTETELEEAFLKDDTLETIVQTQLAGTDIVVGERTLAAMLNKDGSRRITLELLKAQDLSLKDQSSFSAEKIQAALMDAINGKAPEQSGVSKEELAAYSSAVLTGIIADLKDPNTGPGFVRQARDWIGSFASGEDRDYKSPVENAELLTILIKNHPDQAIELIGLLSGSDQIASLAKNQFVKDKLLPALQQSSPQHLNMSIKWLLSDSDVVGKSNIEVLGDLTNEPDVQAAMMPVLSVLFSEGTAEQKTQKLKILKLDEATRTSVFETLQALDFGRSNILSDLSKDEATKDFAKLLGEFKGTTSMNIAQEIGYNAALRTNGVEADLLTIDRQVLNEVSASEKDDEVDMAFNLIGGSFLKTHTQQQR